MASTNTNTTNLNIIINLDNSISIKPVIVVLDTDAQWFKQSPWLAIANELILETGVTIRHIIHHSQDAPFALMLMNEVDNLPVGVSVFTFNEYQRDNRYDLILAAVSVKTEYRKNGLFKIMLSIMKSLLRLQMKYQLRINGASLVLNGGIYLNVDRSNIIAQKTYNQCGFDTVCSDSKYCAMYLDMFMPYTNDTSDYNILADTLMNNSMYLLEGPNRLYDETTQNTVTKFCSVICDAEHYLGIYRFWRHYVSV